MRVCLLALAMIAAGPVLAESGNHDTHVAEAEGLRVVHVWTPAAAKGSDALIYMEIENRSDAEAVLAGGEAMGATLDLVGFSYGAAGETWTVLPGLPVAAGSEIDLQPQVLALRWAAVPIDLVEGADLDVTVTFGDRTLQAEVEIGAPDATAHSHAGHNH